MPQITPQALRPCIGIFGRRNAGKSSLMNFLTGQELAIVSPIAGTTTDPVQKSVEIFPLGPVVLVDTAGLDDDGALGTLRTEKSLDFFSKVHLAVLVCAGDWGAFEESICSRFISTKIPFFVVWSKADIASPSAAGTAFLVKNKISCVHVSAIKKQGLQDLTETMARLMPAEAMATPSLLTGLLPANGLCLFVAPIDGSAPKGRLIAPQVQALRNALDSHVISLVVQPEELGTALTLLTRLPDITICDTQAVGHCAEVLPDNALLTTYSILMARLKGHLPTLAAGAAVIHSLQNGDKVCISEVCTHHSQPDDIGRVQIPRLLASFTGAELDITFAAGVDYPQNISEYKLIIHCGGCMINRPAMLGRMNKAALTGVAITNYGVAISLMRHVLEQTLEVFPEALAAYDDACKKIGSR